jgi:hypothetical protein
MTTFDDRKNAYESKFAHDEALRFRSVARRNKLLGIWAAEKLGKSGPDADAYAREVIRADFAEAGDEDVARKILADFEVTGVPVDAATIRQKMDELLIVAAQQIESEPGT